MRLKLHKINLNITPLTFLISEYSISETIFSDPFFKKQFRIWGDSTHTPSNTTHDSVVSQ